MKIKKSAAMFAICFCLGVTENGSAQAKKAKLDTPTTTAKTASAADTTNLTFEGVGGRVKRALKEPDANVRHARLRQALTDLIPFAEYATGSVQSLLSRAEQDRLDKQVGPSAQQNGTTNAVAKGSVPWLLGFAAEHGAVTQSTTGNTLSFKANPINMIASLETQDYIGSFKFGDTNPLVKTLRPLTLGVSFNASGQNSSGSTNSSTTPTADNSFAGFSAHYDIINRRDPRNAVYGPGWTKLFTETGRPAVDTMNKAFADIREKLGPWQEETATALEKADPNASRSAANSVESILRQQADALKKLAKDDKEVSAALQSYSKAIEAYAKERNVFLDKISKQSILSIEYSLTKQGSQVPSNINSSVSISGPIPDLSALTLIYDRPLPLKSELTTNASVTLFNATPSAVGAGRIRDYRLSAQWDVPVGLLPSNLGQQSVSVSGLFLSLLEQPLGQPVQVNGVNVTTKGNIGLFQAKFTLSVKGTGVKIPFSFTYANRTELIKESDVRGSVGITFDLDSLISKPKGSQ